MIAELLLYYLLSGQGIQNDKWDVDCYKRSYASTPTSLHSVNEISDALKAKYKKNPYKNPDYGIFLTKVYYNYKSGRSFYVFYLDNYNDIEVVYVLDKKMRIISKFAAPVFVPKSFLPCRGL